MLSPTLVISGASTTTVSFDPSSRRVVHVQYSLDADVKRSDAPLITASAAAAAPVPAPAPAPASTATAAALPKAKKRTAAAGAGAAPAERVSASGVTNDFRKPNNTMSLEPLPVLQPSETQSRTSGGTAHILPTERKRATFDVEKLTNVLDGGEEATKKRRWIMSPTEGEDVSGKYYWTRAQYMSEHLTRFMAVHDKFLGYVPTREEVVWMSDNSMLSGYGQPRTRRTHCSTRSRTVSSGLTGWICCELFGLCACAEL
jgi:hypothetical protein